MKEIKSLVLAITLFGECWSASTWAGAVRGATDCDATLALDPVSTAGESLFFASLDCGSIMHFTMLRV
jgi:hypothetical protein